MKTIAVLISNLLVLASASPIANYWFSPVVSLNPYQTQDAADSYRYEFTGPHHAKMETRSNGVTQGGYAYVDANKILQTVAYTADEENGFRVRASNGPYHPENPHPFSAETSEVAAERKRHLDEFEKIVGDKDAARLPRNPELSIPSKDPEEQQRGSNEGTSSNAISRDSKIPFLLTGLEASRIAIPKPDPNLVSKVEDIDRREDNSRNGENTYQNPRYQSLDNPTRVVPLPSLHGTIVAPSTSYIHLPVVPYGLVHSSLRHTQDSLGQYDYSYVGDTSSKTESRALDGTTRGAYSYVDANGLLQQVHYIADHNGFRVLATNLPEA